MCVRMNDVTNTIKDTPYLRIMQMIWLALTAFRFFVQNNDSPSVRQMSNVKLHLPTAVIVPHKWRTGGARPSANSSRNGMDGWMEKSVIHTTSSRK